MGIAGQAATTGEPLLVSDIRDHARLAARESVIQQRITSAMAVPLQVGDRILGSVYVDTRRPGTAFSREDLELFASVASQSAMAIDLVRMHEQMLENEKRRANLGRFLSPAIVEEVLKHDTALQLGGSKRVVTALFCDIRNFTPMAERLTPDELVALLNEHFTAMTGIIFRMQGTLDKYIGDEIMAVFGAPIAESDDALRAVRTALLIQAKNAELNTERAARGAPTFELGIGIASGEVIAGFVGSPERMEFTVVGDRVNTARRLCSVAKGGQVVIAEQTHTALGGALATRPIGPVSLKGKTATETAYEVLPGRPGTTAPDRGGPGLTG
jgi:adenylate cyclase